MVNEIRNSNGHLWEEVTHLNGCGRNAEFDNRLECLSLCKLPTTILRSCIAQTVLWDLSGAMIMHACHVIQAAIKNFLRFTDLKLENWSSTIIVRTMLFDSTYVMPWQHVIFNYQSRMRNFSEVHIDSFRPEPEAYNEPFRKKVVLSVLLVWQKPISQSGKLKWQTRAFLFCILLLSLP